MNKRKILGAALALVGVLAMKQFARANYEQPDYQVESTISEVEIRRYAPYLSAEVKVEGEFQDSMGEGFRRLAGFIFGGNKEKQKISMTSPVMMEGDSPDGEMRTMNFLMPAKYTLNEMPSPNDDGIRFVENPAKMMAALRFPGVITKELWKKKQAELLATLETSKYRPASAVYFFGYDPPMVPGPLRRNEVVVEVELRE